MPRIAMTTAELLTRYKGMSPNQNRIRILADLNGCGPEVISQALGVEDKKKPRKKRENGRLDPVHLREMYDQGLTDAEIADKINRHLTGISQWRKVNGLKPNLKRARKAIDGNKSKQ